MQTINQAELYDGLALQTGYEHHSRNFYANQEAAESKWNAAEAQAAYEGEVVETPVSHMQTIDQAELYNGLAVQLNGIHSKEYDLAIAEQENTWA
jgi:hypothetical protein